MVGRGDYIRTPWNLVGRQNWIIILVTCRITLKRVNLICMQISEFLKRIFGELLVIFEHGLCLQRQISCIQSLYCGFEGE